MNRTRLVSVAAVLSAALLLGWWWSPLSPVAFDRPAAALASGDAEGALEGYLSLAAAPIAERGEALWQAALIAEVELERVAQAALLLQACVDIGGPRAAAASARLARLEPDPVRAIDRWIDAAALDPEHDSAGRWLLNAGEAALAAGDRQRAERALLAATEHDDSEILAWILLGRAALESDPATAHGRYDAALAAGAAGITAELARSGREAAATLMEDGRTLALLESAEE